jgi:hypothetical protein
LCSRLLDPPGRAEGRMSEAGATITRCRIS